MEPVGDDRLEHIVPFLLERLQDKHKKHNAQVQDDCLSGLMTQQEADQVAQLPSPLIVGLNGVQGCGKSTVVSRLKETLSAPPHSLHVVIFSIDDLYLSHEEQLSLAHANASNPLVQHRGQPSTHDVRLGSKILESLTYHARTEIPIYDKSAFDGQGDRVRGDCVVIPADERKADIVILEGWCIGFRYLEEWEKWKAARYLAEHDRAYKGQLGHIKIEDVKFVNTHLKKYDVLTDKFDALIHLDAEDTLYVYDWRLEAEHKLRERTGSGMTDKQVKTFVDGYYPSYELYTEDLRRGAFFEPGKQLRLVLDRERKVKEAFRI